MDQINGEWLQLTYFLAILTACNSCVYHQQVGWAYHVDELLNQSSATLNSDTVRRMILNGSEKWKLMRQIFQLNVSQVDTNTSVTE